MLSSINFNTLEPAHSLKQPEVSKLIRELRQLTGRTQEQMAAVLGVSFSTLNRWEKGRMQPSPLALKQIYALLTQLSHAQIPELQDGSNALMQKYWSYQQHHQSATKGN